MMRNGFNKAFGEALPKNYKKYSSQTYQNVNCCPITNGMFLPIYGWKISCQKKKKITILNVI